MHFKDVREIIDWGSASLPACVFTFLEGLRIIGPHSLIRHLSDSYAQRHCKSATSIRSLSRYYHTQFCIQRAIWFVRSWCGDRSPQGLSWEKVASISRSIGDLGIKLSTVAHDPGELWPLGPEAASRTTMRSPWRNKNLYRRLVFRRFFEHRTLPFDDKS